MLSADEIYLSLNLGGDENIFKPRGDTAGWDVSFPIDWAADPFNDQNWHFQLHAWRLTDPVLERYFKTGERFPIEFAAKVACDWWNWHQDKEAKCSWYDMAAGIRALRIAFLLEAVHLGMIDASYEAPLLEMGQAHIIRLYDDRFIAAGNHGLFQVFGLALLCSLMPSDPRAEEATRFAAEKFKWLFGLQFTEQGVHKENSPTYHRFALNILRRLGGAKRFNRPEFEDLLSAARKVEPWLVLPNGRWARIGDSDGPAGKRDSLEGGCRHLGQDGETYAVLDKEQSGYAIVRSEQHQGKSMLIVAGMAHNMVHKHADELSFELYDHGRMIFIDSGKYGYDNDPMRRYVESADAHNTISLNDRPIGKKDILLDGSLLHPTVVEEGRFIIRGALTRPKAFRQERRIEYAPLCSLQIEDTLSSSEEREYVSSLHLAPDLVPEAEDGGFSVMVGARRITARLIDAADYKIEIVRGAKEPKILGWSTVGYKEMQPATVVRAMRRFTSGVIRWEIDL